MGTSNETNPNKIVDIVEFGFRTNVTVANFAILHKYRDNVYKFVLESDRIFHIYQSTR